MLSVELALELLLVVATALDLLFSQGSLTDEDLIVFGHLINLVLQPIDFILLPNIELPALALLSLLFLQLHSLAILAQQIPLLPDGLILFFGPDHFQLIIVHIRLVAGTNSLIDYSLAHFELFELLGHLLVFAFELLHLLFQLVFSEVVAVL